MTAAAAQALGAALRRCENARAALETAVEALDEAVDALRLARAGQEALPLETPNVTADEAGKE